MCMQAHWVVAPSSAALLHAVSFLTSEPAQACCRCGCPRRCLKQYTCPFDNLTDTLGLHSLFVWLSNGQVYCLTHLRAISAQADLDPSDCLANLVLWGREPPKHLQLAICA